MAGRRAGRERVARERAEDLAFFVVVLGMSPRDYWQLTVVQREAIVSAAKTYHGKK